MRVAWLFNLDADDELRDPQHYVRSQRMLARIHHHLRELGDLVRPGDIVLDDTARPLDDPARRLDPRDAPPATFLGQAWCPTPGALRVLGAAGVERPPAPPVEVLRRVNSRAFIVDWGVGLEGSVWLTSVAEFDAWLGELAVHRSSAPPTWVIKSAFGFAARGLRRFRPDEPATINRRWLSETLRRDGGVQVEPWVERRRDFGLHGWITPDGALEIGRVTVQRCTARGVWSKSRPAAPTDLDDAERRRLQQSARRAARALREAGYFGPFGVDAYRWVDATGTTHLQACSEVNARYSMGWAAGMPQARPRYAPA